MNWVIEIIRNDTGEVTERKIRHSTTAKHRPRGFESELVDGPSTKFPVLVSKEVDGRTVFSVKEDAPKKLKDEKIKKADDEVKKEAAKIFKTKDLSVIQARIASYMLRIQIPHRYSLLKIEVGHAVTGFPVGYVLDTDQKVIDYYSELLFTLDAFRMERAKNLKDG